MTPEIVTQFSRFGLEALIIAVLFLALFMVYKAYVSEVKNFLGIMQKSEDRYYEALIEVNKTLDTLVNTINVKIGR